ncbi:MAG: hypothetical protein HMLKMBBP_02188 [Planctomycetes bacterium]|nr:hypothetical protein [Planctomycetota bacterium]
MLDDIPLEKRSAYHQELYGCAEARAISEALYAGVNPKGSVMVAAKVGGKKHRTLKPACDSCEILLERFGIIDGAR